jgi:hypothetical protein
LLSPDSTTRACWKTAFFLKEWDFSAGADIFGNSGDQGDHAYPAPIPCSLPSFESFPPILNASIARVYNGRNSSDLCAYLSHIVDFRHTPEN